MRERHMKLSVLGAGPAYTNRPGAVGASYLLETDGSAVLLDLGQGAFPALARSLDPRLLDAILISHLHPDHFIDLVPLRHYLRYECRPPARVSVIAPHGLDERLDALHAEEGFTAEALDVDTLDVGRRRIGPFEIEAGLVEHTDDSYAFRVAAGNPGGPGLVYSGDCGRWEDLAALVRPGDSLLVEVSFGPEPVQGGAAHLNGPAVGELARATAPGRVLLTHILMGFDPAETIASVRSRFDGEIGFVWPGDRLTV